MEKTAEQMATEINGKIDGFKSMIADSATKQELKDANDSFEVFKTQNEDSLKSYQKNIDELTNAAKAQSDLIEELQSKLNKGGHSKETVSEQLKKNMPTIKDIAQKVSNDDVVIKADTVRASITNNEQAYDLNNIGQLAHRKLSFYDICRKIPISESNNNGTIRYYDWDAATTVRAAAAVAEGAVFPESTAKWIKGNLPIEKIGDTLPVSEEFYEDEAMFAAELGMFLDTNVKIAREEGLVNGDGTSNALLGLVASVPAYTAAASGISDANVYDLIVKLMAAITEPYGSKYSPDFALMNINDILKMQLKKDANENYIIPPFVSRDGKNVNGVIVLENNFVTANTMVLGDSRYSRIYEKVGVVLSRGHINAQFTEDMETLKARTRLAFLIRNVDKTGFLKVADIDAALVTLAS